MTLNDAKKIATAKLTKDNSGLRLVGYRELPDQFAFFTAVEKSSKMETGSSVLVVFKANKICSWREISKMPDAFSTVPIIDL